MFSNNSYAKLWEIKEIKDKYSNVRISTSTKNKETGEYEDDFNGFARMVGQAHQQLQYMSERDRFKIIRCGVSNKYDKEKKTTYWNCVVFEIEVVDPDDAPDSIEKLEQENPFIKK